MTLDSFNAFTDTVTPQIKLWKYKLLIQIHLGENGWHAME